MRTSAPSGNGESQAHIGGKGLSTMRSASVTKMMSAGSLRGRDAEQVARLDDRRGDDVGRQLRGRDAEQVARLDDRRGDGARRQLRGHDAEQVARLHNRRKDDVRPTRWQQTRARQADEDQGSARDHVRRLQRCRGEPALMERRRGTRYICNLTRVPGAMSNTVGWPKQSTAQNIIGTTRAASESCKMLSPVRWFLNVSSCREMSLLSIIMCISRGNESAHVNAREYVATNRTFMRNMKVKMERRAGDSCLPKTMTCKCRRALVQKFQGHESAGLVRDAKKHRPESILGQDDAELVGQLKATRREAKKHRPESILGQDDVERVEQLKATRRDAKKHRPESIRGQDDVERVEQLKVTRRDESREPTGHHEEQVLRCDRELVGKNKKHHREVARRRIAVEHA